MSDYKKAMSFYVKMSKSYIFMICLIVLLCLSLSAIASEELSNIVNIDASNIIENDVNNNVFVEETINSGMSLLSDIGQATSENIMTSGTIVSDIVVDTMSGGVVDFVIPVIDDSFVDTMLQSVLPVQLSMMSESVPITPALIITEVRIDGSDEYIELTNRGGAFSGIVLLSGVKSSGLQIPLVIGASESIVIGDSLAMVVVSGFTIINNQGLSMTDTSSRSIELRYDNTVIDSVTLTTSQVAGSDNQGASWEYDMVAGVRQVTRSDHNANMITGNYGNPGLVWGLSLFSTTGSVTTGSVTTGIILTGTLQSNTGTILISEVHPFSDCLGEYVALSFSEAYSGVISIAGLGSSNSVKVFPIIVQKPGIRYIVESLSGVLSDNVVVVPGMTLTDGGEGLLVSDGSGLVFDSIVYSSVPADRSSIFTAVSGDIRVFTSSQVPTLPSSCSQASQVPQVGGCRINAQDQGYTTGSFLINFDVSGDVVSHMCNAGIWLIDGQQKFSESCTITASLNPGSHRITYQQYSGSVLLCEDEYMFYAMVHHTTNTVNVSAPSISVSNSSYYESLYRKWKGKYETLLVAVEYVGLTVTNEDHVYGKCDQELLSGTTLASMFDPAKSKPLTRIGDGNLFVFTSILADGTGNDSDGTEMIEFLNKTDQTLDLSDLSLIANNRIISRLTGSVSPRSFVSLVDYFPLSNTAGCVSLYGSGIIYDQVCYGSYRQEHLLDLEKMNAKGTKSTKETKPKETQKNVDEINIKACLKLEEYELMRLDLREQKLINKAQKQSYKTSTQQTIDLYRKRSDQLYTTYRSITDKKQEYIESQKQYITSLQSQLAKSRAYATRITQLYHSSKSYTKTLKQKNDQLTTKSIEDKDILGNMPAQTIEEESSWRSTVEDTVSNLF